MSTLTLGIIIFLGFSVALSTMIVVALQRARAEGLAGQQLLLKLAPYLVIDAAFLIVFVIWLLRNL